MPLTPLPPPSELALQLAGMTQLAIAAASLAIPSQLGWREELRRLEPLTRSVFWTYAAYIWATNVALGLVTWLAAEELSGRQPPGARPLQLRARVLGRAPRHPGGQLRQARPAGASVSGR